MQCWINLSAFELLRILLCAIFCWHIVSSLHQLNYNFKGPSRQNLWLFKVHFVCSLWGGLAHPPAQSGYLFLLTHWGLFSSLCHGSIIYNWHILTWSITVLCSATAIAITKYFILKRKLFLAKTTFYHRNCMAMAHAGISLVRLSSGYLLTHEQQFLCSKILLKYMARQMLTSTYCIFLSSNNPNSPLLLIQEFLLISLFCILAYLLVFSRLELYIMGSISQVWWMYAS